MTFQSINLQCYRSEHVKVKRAHHLELFLGQVNQFGQNGACLPHAKISWPSKGLVGMPAAIGTIMHHVGFCLQRPSRSSACHLLDCKYARQYMYVVVVSPVTCILMKYVLFSGFAFVFIIT